jgi:hypothetical protein
MADAIPVHVHGLLRGAELPSEARLVVDARRIELAVDEGTSATIPLTSVDGLAVRSRDGGHAVALFVAGGDVIDIGPAAGRADERPDHASDHAAALLGAVFALPELTRGLRAFGSGRAMPGDDHDRFFAPLIEPLRRVRASHERALAADAAPWAAVETFDAARATSGLHAAVDALAAQRVPAAGPDRRALTAELLDESEELFGALEALGDAARRLGEAGDETRARAWRAWSAALAAVFVAADRAWTRALPALRAR